MVSSSLSSPVVSINIIYYKYARRIYILKLYASCSHSACLSACLLDGLLVCLSIYLLVCMNISLPVCMPLCLFLYLSVFVSVCIYACPFVGQSIFVSVYFLCTILKHIEYIDLYLRLYGSCGCAFISLFLGVYTTEGDYPVDVWVFLNRVNIRHL